MRFISTILITIVIGIFLIQSLDIKSYQIYHSKRNYHQVTDITKEQTFLENSQIIRSSQKEDWLIEKINLTQKEIKIALYMFTVPSLREALLRAKERGVNIKIILEENPYNAININNETVQFLRKNAFDIYETNNQYFSFMHAKYMIFDNTWIIATANWTRSSFSSNREFFILGNDMSILTDLRNIFEVDFSGGQGLSHDNRIIAGPTNARDRLVDFIQGTNKELDIYTPSFTDEGLALKVQEICATGKAVRILLDKSGKENIAKELSGQKHCPEIHLMKKFTLHAKSIIRDSKEAFIGSFNFTKNSLENNREVGIFIREKSILEIVNSFQEDWEKSIAF